MGVYGDGGRVPDADELARARLHTGMHLIELDEAHCTVRFAHKGVALDFGAIGKGYAVDEAMHILREAGVERAFLHGGTSTMYAIGKPLDADSWNVAVVDPRAPDEPVAVVAIRDEALSVSAVSGKSFEVEGTCYGHVLDPRLGEPVRGALLAATVAPSATTADAISTALLVHARPCPNTGPWSFSRTMKALFPIAFCTTECLCTARLKTDLLRFPHLCPTAMLRPCNNTPA